MATLVIRKRSCKQTGCAFTLIEVLVVVALLAVLAALLLPALAGGKGKARQAQCLSQLEQWVMALHLYSNDNDYAIPRRGQGVRPLTQIDRPTIGLMRFRGN